MPCPVRVVMKRPSPPNNTFLTPCGRERSREEGEDGSESLVRGRKEGATKALEKERKGGRT